MITNFKDGRPLFMNGAKMWLNAPFADIAIVWAKK
jgi:hypothetical protein